jgi:hypothetical protein
MKRGSRNFFYGGMLVLAISVGTWEAIQQSRHRAVKAVHQKENERLRRMVLKLEAEVAAESQRVHALQGEVERLRPLAAEVYKLRSRAVRSIAGLGSTKSNDPSAEQVLQQWLRGVEDLKTFFSANPEQAIPELQLLSEDDWLSFAKRWVLDHDEAAMKDQGVQPPEGWRFAGVRTEAKRKFVFALSAALRGYVADHGGMLPADLHQVQPYFAKPDVQQRLDSVVLDSRVLSELIGRYELLQKGLYSEVPDTGVVIVAEKFPVDPKSDWRLVIGKDWFQAASPFDPYHWRNHPTKAQRP